MKRLLSLIIVGIFLHSISLAQTYNWETLLDIASDDGFHNIIVPPQITAKSKSQLADLRIFDENNEEVPYVFHQEKSAEYKTLFKEYKIIEKKHDLKNNYTRLVIHNKNKNEISDIRLIIRNSDVKKWLKLNASDDNKKWFVLKDNYRFHSFYSDEGISEIKVLNFPQSNYEYYELLISDYYDKPINILKAGYYDTKIENGKYSEVTSPTIFQNDTSKKRETTVFMKFDEHQYIDKLEFEIEGPEYYFRNARLEKKIIKQHRKKKRQQKSYMQTIENFDLSSFSTNTIFLSNYKTDSLYLTIINNDDKPLKIKSVRGYQLNNYLTVSLKKDKKYVIRFGNEELKAPVYDLQHFMDSIPKNLPTVKTKEIIRISKEKSIKETPAFFSSIFIWIAIVAVALLLGFMSIKMIKDMGKDKKE